MYGLTKAGGLRPLPTRAGLLGSPIDYEKPKMIKLAACTKVQGEIRELWLRLGGVQSKLGYPIEDETLTPDHLGRLSVFEHGEISWYPKKRAYVRQRGQPYGKGRHTWVMRQNR